MDAIEPQFAVFVPLLIGFLAAIKQAGFNTRYIPLFSITAGLIIGLFIFREDIKSGVIFGLTIGLSAIGTHSGLKNTFRNRQKK